MKKILGLVLLMVGFYACKGPESAEAPAALLSEQQIRKFDNAFFEGIKHKSLDQYPEAIRSFEKAIQLDPSQAAAHYELAQVYLLDDRAEPAQIAAERAVQLDPENEWYSILLISIYEWQRDYTKQAALYESMLERNPGNADYLHDLAITYLQQNKVQKAIETYDRLEEIIGVTADVVHQKKQLYLSLNRLDDAVREVRKLISHQPERAEHQLSLAQLLLSNDRVKEAEEAMNKALELGVRGRDAITLGDLYGALGKIDRALDAYRGAFADASVSLAGKVSSLMRWYNLAQYDSVKRSQMIGLIDLAVEAHPSAPEVHSLRADFLMLDGQYSAVREALGTCIELGGNTYEVWLEYVLMSSNLEDWARMEQDAQSALELFPVQTTFYYLKGVAQQELQAYDRARRSFEEGLNYALDDPALKLTLLSALGELCHRLEDGVASDRYFDQALKLDSANALILNNYAWYLALRGARLDRAEAMTRRSNEISPNNSTYLDTYAWVLYRAGRFSEALVQIERALGLGGRNSAEILDHYAEILWGLNRFDAARQAWSDALQVDPNYPELQQKLNQPEPHE